ncbi:hypothetical protein JOH51_000261 [Rhizobium leguminosarum]|nr:hypothetical protein [Rhizobium leguminosarum]
MRPNQSTGPLPHPSGYLCRHPATRACCLVNNVPAPKNWRDAPITPANFRGINPIYTLVQVCSRSTFAGFWRCVRLAPALLW